MEDFLRGGIKYFLILTRSLGNDPILMSIFHQWVETSTANSYFVGEDLEKGL